jgi:putative transposase
LSSEFTTLAAGLYLGEYHNAQGCARKKVVTAAARREAARYLQESYQVSERRVGRLLLLSNSSLRYRSRRPEASDLRQRLRELAVERPRYGYQRLWVLLRRAGWIVNHKRIYRLYCEEGLKLRKRRRRARAQVERVPLLLPTKADERYSMDFMRDTLADGRVFRVLNIVDDYTRECLAIEVDTSLPGERVVRVLDRLAAMGRQPLHIVIDNGPEFASRAVDQWAARRGVNLRFIDPGKPMQNGYIESFNGKFRDECLSQHWFISLDEARSVSEEWRVDYNERRPHRSLQQQTPAEFAAKCSSYQAAELSL